MDIVDCGIKNRFISFEHHENKPRGNIEPYQDDIAGSGTGGEYGSRARGDAREDSDWDILILIDKDRVDGDDYDAIAYPLFELGWELDEAISPVLYTEKDWQRYISPRFTIMWNKKVCDYDVERRRNISRGILSERAGMVDVAGGRGCLKRCPLEFGRATYVLCRLLYGFRTFDKK